MKGGYASEDFVLECADIKMLLRNIDSEISLIKQMWKSDWNLLVLKQVIPRKWDEITPEKDARQGK